MNEALDRQLVRLRTRLAKTPLPRFFAWWGGELLACLPPRWHALLADRAESLLLEVRGKELVVWREQGAGTREFGRVDLGLPPEAQAAEFRHLRERIDDPDLRTVFCIPGERALRRTVSLPAAAEENLRQVLAFEMDRQTPFKADQVYFDSRVTGHDGGGRNIQVDLVVLPRAQLDSELAAVAGGAIALDGVDAWRDAPGGERRRINLLPPERRARRRNLRLPLNLGLAALAVLLLFVNMSESLSNRAAAVEAMHAEVTKDNADAKQVVALKKSLQDSIAGANFLADKKRRGPVVIAMLNDLTHRLGDDTYLERLQIENSQVQLQGQSNEAAKLIGVLQDSQYLSNPRLEGQIQPDPRTGKDRFQITADIKQTAPAKPDAAAKTAAGRKGAGHGDA